MPTLLVFIYLQLLDFLTTILFVSLGVQEGNILVGPFLNHDGNYLGAFLFKLIGTCTFVVLYLKFARVKKCIILLNYFFMAVIVWNLVVTIFLVRSVMPTL